MASLYIKDSETAELAAELARLLNMSKTQAVRDALQRRKAEVQAQRPKGSTAEWLVEYRRKNPLPPPTGMNADKAFFDWLSGEEDVPDVSDQ